MNTDGEDGRGCRGRLPLLIRVHLCSSVSNYHEKESRGGPAMPAPSPARKPWWRRWFGSRSERAAARFLRRRGYRVVARNYACPLGELDLVAVDAGCVVFVEVRSTETDDPARPAASVDARKQRRLTDLALHFLR